MDRRRSQEQTLLFAALLVAVLIFAVLGYSLYRVITNAAKLDDAAQTQAGASSAALALANQIGSNTRLVGALTGEDGLSPIINGNADPLSLGRVEYANQNIQRANPQLTGLYFYDNTPSFIFGQVVDPTHQTQSQQGASCDSSSVFCSITTEPSTGYFATTAYRAALGRALDATGQPFEVLIFGPQEGPLGSLYIFQPIVQSGSTHAQGVLVGRIDAASIFSSFVRPGTSGNMILDGSIVIGPTTASAHQQGQLPVLSTAGLNPVVLGGLKPALVGYQLTGDSPVFTLGDTSTQGSRVRIGSTGFSVLNYAPASALSASAASLILAAVAFFLVLIATMVGLVFYYNQRVQRSEQEKMQIIRARSEALTEDIVSVSQALSVARGGDLTVQIPDSESEVGLLSLSLNGLISDYGQIVGGIVRASQAVQDGAARVDDSVRRIVEVATNQAETVSSVAGSMEDVASSAVDVQQATTLATTLAASARGAVQSGQQSVSRIAEAVDAIKQAAIGTTREFKRLQEDSIRLTALVASVKNNAENLDMQAANATLEARHLGTESGSNFAANIGRLARQAQDTLADAEGAVRSVVASIDEVNRRIERISEQVRRGVEDVRMVRSTFDDITKTNTSLVQFIDNVADSASIQARSAQQAAYSISEISQVFEQFTELLIASGDEIANMRLIVAGLRESVADLRVEQETAPIAALGRESAA